MLIDWFTVGAQAVNFLVLVWLLKRFLYQPVLSAIDARENRIAGDLAAAAAQKTEVQKSREELAAQVKAFDEDRETRLAKATLDAAAAGAELLRKAREAADALTAARHAALQSEAAKLSRDLARLAAAESMSIARAALKDLAGAELQGRMVSMFAQRVRQMDPRTKESMAASLKLPGSEPSASSAFELSDPDKATIQTALNETFSADIRLHFRTSSAAIAGIELDIAGQRLSWSVADYMTVLESRVDALITQTAEGVANAAATAPITAAPDPVLAAA
jgi:F-type H+-transporting ATPase subunit b